MDIPWEAVVFMVAGFSTMLGILWKRLVDKDDEHREEYREIIDRQHAIIVKIHQSIDIPEEEEA